MTAEDSAAGRDKHCGGKKRGPGGGTCTRPAGWGTEHVGIGRCKLHGGNTPTHVAAAERVALADLAGRYSVPREVHPLDGVMEQYHRYAGQVAYLEAKVNELPEEDLFWGVESETDRAGGDGEGPGYEVKRKAGTNAVLRQLNETQREYARMGLEILRVGLESAVQAAGGRFGAQLSVVLESLMADCARAAAERAGGSEAELLAAFQSLAVAKIAAFAGASPRALDGTVAA